MLPLRVLRHQHLQLGHELAVAAGRKTALVLAAGMAFAYFLEQEVELAIVEAGLGGRLDSTNVLKPEVCGMTSISYDHVAQLGHTLEKIAEEKDRLFKLRFQLATGQLENSARLGQTKKDIARLATELRAREIAAAEASAGGES